MYPTAYTCTYKGHSKTTCLQLSLSLLPDLVILQSHKLVNWGCSWISLSPLKVASQYHLWPDIISSVSKFYLPIFSFYTFFSIIKAIIQLLIIYLLASLIASGLGFLHQSILHGPFGDIFLKYKNYHVYVLLLEMFDVTSLHWSWNPDSLQGS